MNTQKNMQSQPNTNLRLEQAVIAGLLVSPEAIFDVADRLQPDMFSDNRTGFVYRAVLSLMASGTAVDMLTVENEMRRLDNGLYIQLNGLSFLSDMLLDVRSDAHIRIHADELVRCYTLRQLVNELKKKETADFPGFKQSLFTIRFIQHTGCYRTGILHRRDMCHAITYHSP